MGGRHSLMPGDRHGGIRREAKIGQTNRQTEKNRTNRLEGDKQEKLSNFARQAKNSLKHESTQHEEIGDTQPKKYTEILYSELLRVGG